MRSAADPGAGDSRRLFWTVALTSIVLDQITKFLAEATLLRSAAVSVFGDWAQLRLVYNLRPELGLSDVKLLTAAGSPHPVGKVTLDSLTLVVPVPTPPPPGRYTISWRTASSDGHPIRGTIPFEVAPPAVGSAEGAAPVHLSRDHTVR